MDLGKNNKAEHDKTQPHYHEGWSFRIEVNRGAISNNPFEPLENLTEPDITNPLYFLGHILDLYIAKPIETSCTLASLLNRVQFHFNVL